MDGREKNLAEKCHGLQKALQRLTPEPGEYRTRVKGLTLFRGESPNAAGKHGVAEPHVTIVFQGAERVIAGDETLICGACQCRVIGVELFGTGCVASASPEHPFLALSLSLDQRLLDILASSFPPYARGGRSALLHASVAAADPAILDAFLRLADLLEHPAHIPVLAPLLIWEIHYRLLIGAHGAHSGTPQRVHVH